MKDLDIAPRKKHETNSGALLQLNQVSIFSLNIGEKKSIVAHLTILRHKTQVSISGQRPSVCPFLDVQHIT